MKVRLGRCRHTMPVVRYGADEEQRARRAESRRRRRGGPRSTVPRLTATAVPIGRTGGAITGAADLEIIDGIRLLARTEGVFADTAGSVS